MIPLARPFFKQYEVTHTTACRVYCRRREEAIEWLPITEPSVKGAFGEVNSPSCNSQMFRRCEKTSSENPEDSEKTGKEQKSKTIMNNQSPTTGNRHDACCLIFLCMRLALV